jgi:hypothetical protein
MNIPKIILQTSKEGIPEYVVKMIKERAPDWEYRHFILGGTTDEDNKEAIQYFKDNPLPEFPDIIDKFLSIEKGLHKSDLFRYYFLYIEGGIYLDSDAMFEIDLEEIVKDYHFFTVQSYTWQLMCNGLIGCSSKNEMMYQCLKDAYNCCNNCNENYFLIPHCLFMYIRNYKNELNYKIKVYNEYANGYHKAITLNEEGKVIFNHYYKEKVVPLLATY